MLQHRKDLSSLRGLKALVVQRRKLLQYLGRKDFERYSHVLRLLQIKPVSLPGSMNGLLREQRYAGRPKTDKDRKRRAAAVRKAKSLEDFQERQKKRETEARRREQQLRVRPSLLQRRAPSHDAPPDISDVSHGQC